MAPTRACGGSSLLLNMLTKIHLVPEWITFSRFRLSSTVGITILKVGKVRLTGIHDGFVVGVAVQVGIGKPCDAFAA
jgi:hypothetical protein